MSKVLEYRIYGVSKSNLFTDCDYGDINLRGGDTLKTLGKQGWELCSVIDSDAHYFIFKREKRG